MSANAMAADAAILPPMKTGVRKPQNFAVAAGVAEENALFAGIAEDIRPRGYVYIAVKAVDSEMWIWFKAATDSTATVSSSTGYHLPENSTEYFWVHADTVGAVEVIATSNGTLSVTVTSDEYNTGKKGRVLPTVDA